MRTKDLLKYLVALMMGTGLSEAQLTQTENYVYSKTYLSKTGDTIQKPAMETVTYFDGLGRPKQSIIVKGTPSGQDLVTPIKYDGFGRQALDILPVPVQSTSSGYHAGIIDETTANTYYSSPSLGLGGNAFSEKILENSPLDRIQAQYGPGDAWKSNSKKTEFSYETNGTEVKRYTATFDYATFTSAITLNGAYAANTLYRNRIKDEDGNTTMEYKNGLGQTILVRKIAGTTISQGLAPVDNNVYADTYYIYNDYNQLAFVIPPLAVAAGNVSQTTLENLCYQYKYDGRGRLVEKKLPGKEWEFMVYDKKDRLILTQDINLRGTNNNFGGKGWLFTKYDQFGRVVYTGFFANTATRSSMQTALNNMNSSNNEERVSAPSITLQGLPLYYTKTAFPTGSMTLLSVNYYDTYPVETPFPTKKIINGSQQSQIFGEAILPDNYGADALSTKSLPLASFVKNINDDSWTKNYTFYDKKGRPIGNHSTNHLGGNTIIHSRLDFTGTVQKTKTYHRKLSTELPIVIEENFEYDNQNRLVKHYHEVMGKSPKELLTQNEYNESGTLKSKKVGATGNSSGYATPLQSINYDYNIRGWLTGINLNQYKTLNPDKLFSYKIRYDDPTNPALQRFNGNISEVDWTFGADTSSRYDYSYDMLNRLRKADFKTVGITETSDNKFFNEELQYDLNGNITELKRFAKTQVSTTIGTMIDDLSYTYAGTNAVTVIADATSNALGYKGSGLLPITYDANGNMKTFPDKGITQNIVYNYLNLPENIVQNGLPTNNIYRADGVKVHKNYAINGTIINTDYIDGFVYTSKYTLELQDALSMDDQPTRTATTAGQEETFVLADRVISPVNPPSILQSSPNFFTTAEGFYDFENFKYIYQYKDHLGNVRLSYSWNKSDNKIDIEDTNNYYPFGLSFITENAFGGSQYSPSTTYKNYKYNGKELQETGMYDYGARMYMPDIGRWNTIDKLSEKYFSTSTYTYVLNRPTVAVDPDGKRVYFIGAAGNDPESQGWNYVNRWGNYFSQAGINFYRVNATRGTSDDIRFTAGFRNTGYESVMRSPDMNSYVGGLSPSMMTTNEQRPVQDDMIDATVSMYQNHLKDNPLQEGEQFNMAGYSYGSVLQAQAALKLADSGQVIDNVVLIGSPISDKSDLMKQLKGNKNIKNVIRYDIAGDKLSNPKDILEFIQGGYESSGAGQGNDAHHFDAARPGQQSNQLIQTIIQWLQQQGVEN